MQRNIKPSNLILKRVPPIKTKRVDANARNYFVGLGTCSNNIPNALYSTILLNQGCESPKLYGDNYDIEDSLVRL